MNPSYTLRNKRVWVAGHRGLVGSAIVRAAGESVDALGLSGEEVFSILGMADAIKAGLKSGRDLTVKAQRPNGSEVSFRVTMRIDTPEEIRYVEHGGILQYVLRQLANS